MVYAPAPAAASTDAVPPVNGTGAPSAGPPTWLNWIVPVGVPAPGAVAATVAVMVICWPATEGDGVTVNVVVVAAGLGSRAAVAGAAATARGMSARAIVRPARRRDGWWMETS